MAGNPIYSVNNLSVPSPSAYRWSKFKVSSPDAGRTEDATMHTETITNKVKLELSWKNVSIADASTILDAFEDSEYLSVKYLDAKLGDYVTKTFYIGDRNAPLYNSALGIWESVSFDLIEQ